MVKEASLGTLAQIWAQLLDGPTREEMSAQARLRSPEGAAARLAGLIKHTLEVAPQPGQNKMQRTL